MQPKPVMKPFFSCSIHLINPFTIAVELECGCVSNMLSGLGALIYISIDKGELWELFTELAKCRKNLIANSTPSI